jgi:hypothetical protein
VQHSRRVEGEDIQEQRTGVYVLFRTLGSLVLYVEDVERFGLGWENFTYS